MASLTRSCDSCECPSSDHTSGSSTCEAGGRVRSSGGAPSPSRTSGAAARDPATCNKGWLRSLPERQRRKGGVVAGGRGGEAHLGGVLVGAVQVLDVLQQHLDGQHLQAP